MTEFKFYCPKCGQHIKCDTGYAGTQINCPACHQAIVVLQAPTFTAPVPPPAAASPAIRRGTPALAAGRESSDAPVPTKSRTWQNDKTSAPKNSNLKKNIGITIVGLAVVAGLVAAWFYFRKSQGHGEIGITFGVSDQVSGLERMNNRDGNSVLTNAFGSPCRLLEERFETYLYLQVDPKLKKHTPMMVTVTIEWLAAKPGTFDVQYDGGTPDSPYTASGNTAVLNGSGEWQTKTFDLSDARFQNRQNNRADFRLRVNCPEFYVRRVTVGRD